MDEQKLNRKLADWAGLSCFHDLTGGLFYACNGQDDFEMCNFTQSLDVCFRQLVPRAIDEIMAEQECSSDVAYAILFQKWLQELELIIPNAALALCLAIEKLMKLEVKDGWILLG